MRYKRAELVSRHLSEFDIQRMQVCNRAGSQIVTCGKENVRLWRLRNGHLTGSNVALNNNARGQTFTALCVVEAATPAEETIRKKGAGAAPRTVLAATDLGLLFRIVGTNLEEVTKIHDSKITAIAVCMEKGFALSAATEGVVRVWD